MYYYLRLYIPTETHLLAQSKETVGGIGLKNPPVAPPRSWNGCNSWVNWSQCPHNLVCKWQSWQRITATCSKHFMQSVSSTAWPDTTTSIKDARADTQFSFSRAVRCHQFCFGVFDARHSSNSSLADSKMLAKSARIK